MNTERTSSLDVRAALFAALADVARLQVVDALALSDRSPSELQATVGLPSNLMAHHLKVLQDAGIIMRRRSEGDRRRTYLSLVDPSIVDRAPAEIAADRVLFVCSANSARSQLAAALWKQMSKVPVASAGTHPAKNIAQEARAVAARHNLSLQAVTPQRFDRTIGAGDLVVAVCDSAYEELGTEVSVHWSIPDPVRMNHGDAFESAYVEISRRVSTLAPRLLAS